MDEREMRTMEERVGSLNEQADELLSKLATINQLLPAIEAAFSKLPSQDDLEEYAKAMPSVRALEEFAEAWASNDLPSIDELQEYARAAQNAAAGLQAAE